MHPGGRSPCLACCIHALLLAGQMQCIQLPAPSLHVQAFTVAKEIQSAFSKALGDLAALNAVFDQSNATKSKEQADAERETMVGITQMPGSGFGIGGVMSGPVHNGRCASLVSWWASEPGPAARGSLDQRPMSTWPAEIKLHAVVSGL